LKGWYLDFAPVLDDEEAIVVYRHIIADHNAGRLPIH
jgi:hypothetical protein